MRIGNIRGARIALGRHGNVYVAWNGSAKLGEPALGRSPMLFTRLNESRTAFEPERNLIHIAYGINGGGGIAADQQGDVYVFWHAPIPGRQGEEFRRVWIARSEDDGASFAPERIAWNQPTGVCGCCSLDAFADRAGTIYVLFRSAHEMLHGRREWVGNAVDRCIGKFFDKRERVGHGGTANGVPAWSLIAAFPQRNGNFVVLY